MKKRVKKDKETKKKDKNEDYTEKPYRTKESQRFQGISENDIQKMKKRSMEESINEYRSITVTLASYQNVDIDMLERLKDNFAISRKDFIFSIRKQIGLQTTDKQYNDLLKEEEKMKDNEMNREIKLKTKLESTKLSRMGGSSSSSSSLVNDSRGTKRKNEKQTGKTEGEASSHTKRQRQKDREKKISTILLI